VTHIAITIGPADWPWIIGAIFLLIVLLALVWTR
jgi:hypothetical protein